MTAAEYAWPESARTRWLNEYCEPVCLRCGQTAERTRPSQGFAATPPQCRCEGRLR